MGDGTETLYWVRHDADLPRGTFEIEGGFVGGGRLCERCGWPLPRTRTYPAHANWNCGWAHDFMWEYWAPLICKSEVAEVLMAECEGLEFMPIQFVNRKGESVPGPRGDFVELIRCKHVAFNPGVSRLRKIVDCPECGTVNYMPWGLDFPGPWEAEAEWRLPRGRGLRIPRAEVAAAGIFTYGSMWTIWTDRIVQLARSKGWKNLAFFEYGQTI